MQILAIRNQLSVPKASILAEMHGTYLPRIAPAKLTIFDHCLLLHG